jgi:nicotinate phosphoribosyltransferase
MIRKGPGTVGGLEEARAMIAKYSPLFEHGGHIESLDDGDSFEKGETLMMVEGPIQDIVALETMYLGVISADTTLATDGVEHIDTNEVRERMREVVEAAAGRPVMYFGARHWRYDEDRAISAAAFEGGATSCSTDIGASSVGLSGIGTIPHVLENIVAWKVGASRAVVEATLAFDRHIDKSVPRIALIDYNNREIDDSVATAKALGGRLSGVRVDTCGENIAQGALSSPLSPEAADWRAEGIALPGKNDPNAKYWYGNGVTVTGVYRLRKALDAAGFSDVKIILSSGFGDAQKVRAFIEAEKILGTKLFDSLGVGGVYDSRSAKTDIVRVGSSPDALVPISKAGRHENPNPRLTRKARPSEVPLSN